MSLFFIPFSICAIYLTLSQRYLHAALPTTVSLNDGDLKGYAFKTRDVQGNIPGGHGEFARVVTTAVCLTLFTAFVPRRRGQLLRLQQTVEGFLHTATYQFFDLPLDYFLV